MKVLMIYMRVFLGVLFLIVGTWGFVEGYPYLFAKTIEGKLEKVERVMGNVNVLQSVGADNQINPVLYSFAVAIKADDGKIWTASAEDRQWASLLEGRCVKAKFFPYPPWRLDKSGTYYGARLLEAWECK